ncbi:hypothetical protein Tco_0861010 [Tanacetum coccineum]|uniref:Uncharacterized protein n=1 Tax=Tanacetum coccineum TaxID=301880 RepID=A0ABQ5BKA1_9ASTR
MAALESCPKHNMIAYLEKTDGNAEFHEIIDFRTRSSIHYALTVSPVVSTTFVEHFWMSAKSKTINNVRYINAKVAGKRVTISEVSIRSDLLFDDADVIDSLNNQDIFDTIQLMGSESTSWDQIATNIATTPDPSPRPSPSISIPASNPEGSGENQGGQSSSDRSQSGNEDGLTLQTAHIKKLKRKARPVISHHKAWMKSVSMKKILAKKKSLKKKRMLKESGVSTEDKVITDKPKVSTDKPKVSTDQQNVSTDKHGKGTAEPKDGYSEESTTPTALTTTSTPTLTVFGDDETIAEFLVYMSQNKAKQKGVEIKDAKDSDRPRPTLTRFVLTWKPLPKIDPKDKGKKVLEEEVEWPEKFKKNRKQKRKRKCNGYSRKAQNRSQKRQNRARERKEREAKAKKSKPKTINYDDIQARMEADRILVARLQEEERVKFTIEEREKFLHDTIAAQRRFLAQQRATEIRSRPPTRTQLRNQMMTYLKHVGGKKHYDLKNKNFKEIQVLYEKVKRSDENFIPIGSAGDEKLIKDVNKKATGIKKDDSIKEERKEEESTRKRKLGTRKKMKAKKRKFRQDPSKYDEFEVEKENDELRLCLTIAPDEDKEVDYEILDKKHPIIE